MALFTDGYISEVQDLLAYESNLVEVADAEGIDLEGKLRLAQSEVGVELGAAALGPGNIYWTGQGAAGNFSRFGLEQVVATAPLKLWHAFQTLAIVYRDAYNRKLNDKYLPKWTEYQELARWASNLLYQTGIGLVTKPAPRPQKPVLDTVSGSLPAQTAFVRMAWIGEGGESAPSEELALDVPENQSLRVTPPATPEGVTGWNVYVGGVSGEGARQNAEPLAAGLSWVMPETGLAAGPAAGEGQGPELFKAIPKFLQRG
jgi:hypothetical protein